MTRLTKSDGTPLTWPALAGILAGALSALDEDARYYHLSGLTSKSVAQEAADVAAALSGWMAGKGIATWTPEVAAECGWKAGLDLRSDLADSEILEGRALGPSIAKAVHAAWCLSLGNPDDVTPHERARLAAFTDYPEVTSLTRLLKAPAAPPPRHEGTSVTFAARCRRVRKGARKGQEFSSVVGRVELGEASVAEAPVVVELREADGRSLPIRRQGADFLRPVMAPGGREAMDLDAFAWAAARAPAWGDNPFLPRMSTDGVTLGLDSCAGGPNGREEGAAEVARSVARAGRLVLVDGVVHKVVPEPTVQLLRQDRRYAIGASTSRMSLSWRVGSGFGMHVKRDTVGRPVAHGHDAPVWPHRGPGLPLGDVGALLSWGHAMDDAGRGWASEMGRDCPFDATVPFVVRDPSAFPSHDRVAFEALLGWAKACLTGRDGEHPLFQSARAVLAGEPDGADFDLSAMPPVLRGFDRPTAFDARALLPTLASQAQAWLDQRRALDDQAVESLTM